MEVGVSICHCHESLPCDNSDSQFFLVLGEPASLLPFGPGNAVKPRPKRLILRSKGRAKLPLRTSNKIRKRIWTL